MKNLKFKPDVEIIKIFTTFGGLHVRNKLNLKIKNLFDNINFSDLKFFPENYNYESLEITSIVSDSRSAKVGSLFICFKGTKSNGHMYINEAVKNGAVFVIIQKGEQCSVPDGISIPDGVPYAVSDDTRRTAALLWDLWYSHPSKDMKIVAVTGTNGKTSTSYILRAIMKYAGYKTGLIGTVRCLIGDDEYDLHGGSEVFGAASAMTTPDPEMLYHAIDEMREKGVEILIMEASSHAIELNKLAGLACENKIDIGVFTNISPEHLDFHETMENYIKAKAKLFTMCKKGIVNVDDEHTAHLMEYSDECEFVGFSVNPDSIVNPGINYTAVKVKSLGVNGVEYILYSNKAVFKVRSMIPGKFTVYNTMAAIACAIELGVNVTIIREAVESLAGVEGRIERVKLDPSVDFSVFIDYAHTAAALENMLLAVREFRQRDQRITLLFGCGGDRDPSKRKMMGAMASKLADFVIVTSDNSRTENPKKIISEILRGIDKEKPHIAIENREDAIKYAVMTAGKNDIIILAGKGHEKYEIDINGKHAFDEAELIGKYINIKDKFSGKI